MKRPSGASHRAVLEALEARLLLTVGPVTISDALGAPVKSLTYTDPDGTAVTVSVVKGSATIDLGADFDWTAVKGVARPTNSTTLAEIDTVVLANTGAKSSLTFKTVKPAKAVVAGVTPDDRANVTSISGTALGQLNAGKIDLLGEIDLAGMAACTLGNVPNGGTLDFGGAATDSMTFAAGTLAAPDLSFNGTIKQLTVSAWTDGGSVTAAAVTKLAATAGDFWAAVTAPNGIGSVTVTGGDLVGALTAASGPIGNITVTGTAQFAVQDGVGQGQMAGGNIFSPQITAGPAAKGLSLGNLTTSGGGIGGPNQTVVIQAAGDMGNISTKGLKYKVASNTYNGKAVISYDFEQGDIYADVQATGRLGAVSATGGDIDGSLDAASVGNVSVSSALLDIEPGYRTYLGGALSGAITADTSIGNVTGTGGDVTLTLTAGTKIGKIGLKAVTQASTVGKDATNPANWWANPGGAWGISLDLTIHLAAGAQTALGAITASGATITLQGDAAFGPCAGSVLAKSTAVTYIDTYTEDATTHKPVAHTTTLGGTVTGGLDGPAAG